MTAKKSSLFDRVRRDWERNREDYFLNAILIVLVAVFIAFLFKVPDFEERKRANIITPCGSRVIKYIGSDRWCIHEVQVGENSVNYTPIQATCLDRLSNVEALCRPLEAQR